MVPDGSKILHDVNQLLYEHKVTDRNMQEFVIKRYMTDEPLLELQQIMDYYKVKFTCDFKELQAINDKDIRKDDFKIR